MHTIYYVRHGENRANITKEFSYKLVDYSLTAKGVEQAEQTARYFRNHAVDRIYASPLKRTVETAAIIGAALKLHYEVDEDLREIDIGDLEGRKPDREAWRLYFEILQEWRAGRHYVAFPNGEDFNALRSRFVRALKGIVANRQGEQSIVVGHGGILDATIRTLTKQSDIESLTGREQRNCSITKLEVELVGGELVCNVVEWAWADHLHGAARNSVSGLPDY